MSRARRSLAVLALAAAVAAFPLGALASHNFADVPDSNVFHADISALVAAGVTSGCGGGNYCPSANVTREQMAAFMNRLGALAPGKTPVVNATKLDGLDSTDFLQPGITKVAFQGGIFPENNDPPTSIYASNAFWFINKGSAGTASVIIPLSTPITSDGVARAWVDVEICFTDSDFVTLDALAIWESNGPSSTIPIDDDQTNRDLAGAGCYTLDATAYTNSVYEMAGPLTVQVTLVYDQGAWAGIQKVTVRWAAV